MALVQNAYSIAAHYGGDFDEDRLQEWTEDLRRRFAGPRVSFGMVFMSPRFFPYAPQVLELLRVHGRIPLLVGCSSTALVAGDREIEDSPGLVLGLYHLPGATLQACYFTQDQVESVGDPGYWPGQTGVAPEEVNGWLVFIDPFHLDPETWLRTWNEAYAPRPVVGGLASGEFDEPRTQIYLNGEVHEEGGVAVAVCGEVELHSVLSQGCTPIGETWTITKAERNFIHEIGSRPAYTVLAETFSRLPSEERKKAQGNLLLGLAVNEYLEEFHRGDFLIRNLIGADPVSGVLAVGAFPRTGQTVQFQRRDPLASTEDLEQMLERARVRLLGRDILGGVLCTCNGRGFGLFGEPDHDARHVQQKLGPMGLAGFFCNGEIGPVGERNFLHGYTASLGLFVKKA